jgi:hypothetical protein
MQVATHPSNVDEALAMLRSSLDHLTSADWRALGSMVQARALRELGAAQSKLTVARGEALGAFDASGGHSADGHPTAQAWLRNQAQMTGKDARDLGAWERMLRTHPVLRDAIAAEELSQSWARQFAAWNDRLPEAERDQADKILLDAARAGLPLRTDIARLAQAIYEAVRAQQPDADPDDGGFADRGLRFGTTIGGAGRLQGDLSARCAELLAKALEAFGKPAGHDDLRTQAQRNHDALEAALGLSLGAPDVPQSGGMKTQAQVVIFLADLIAMDEGSVLVEKWLKARTGETGWLSGDGAEAAACAAHITPVVVGAPDWDVISEMADVFLDAHGISHGLSREARLALERTLLAMAIQALSGPDGLAGFLRANLLDRPFSGASLPLDLGNTDRIPDYLRRAVILRDRKCQWPGGCDRPASQCEPHHLRPRSEGGETSLANMRLFCFAHHHIYIHRLGWKIQVHPDGSSTATSPRGRVIHSHGPRASRLQGPGPRDSPTRGRRLQGHGPPGGSGSPGSTGPPGNPVG